MAKLTTNAIKKSVKKLEEVKNIKFHNGMETQMMKYFKNTDIETMGQDFTETLYHTVVTEDEAINYSNLLYFYVIKHFTTIGQDIQKEFEKKIKKSGANDYETVVKMKVENDLMYFDALIDLEYVEEIVNNIEASEFVKIDKALIEVSKRVQEEVNKTRQEESASK